MTGDETPEQVFLAVATALSWWEETQDKLMRLFDFICGEVEPVAKRCYREAPRKVRDSMMKLALETYPAELTDSDRAAVLKSIIGLDKLARIRNEIAHGHVSSFESRHGNEVTMSGHFLMPGFAEWEPFQPGFRFTHTSGTIGDFERKVRVFGGIILDVWSAAQMRRQNADLAAGPEVHSQRNAALKVARREIPATQVRNYIRPFEDWPR